MAVIVHLTSSSNNSTRAKRRASGTIRGMMLVVVLGLMLVVRWIGPPDTMIRVDDADSKTTAMPKNNNNKLVSTTGFVPQEVDCSAVDKASLGELFVVNTKADPTFQILTHNPKYEKMSEFIQKDGCFECEMLELVKENLLKHEGSYLLDIGGNLGLFSLLAASVGRHVYTFEPFPENWHRLCHSIALNQLGSKIHLFNAPLGDTEEDLFFQGPKNNLGAVGTVPLDRAFDLIYRNATEQDVANKFTARRLDQFAPVLPPPSTPVILKVDIEGSECPALLGGIEWLEKANIVWAVVETSQYSLRKRCHPHFDRLVQMFEKKGLKAYYYSKRTDLIGPVDTSTWFKDIENRRWMYEYQPERGNVDIVWKK